MGACFGYSTACLAVGGNDTCPAANLGHLTNAGTDTGTTFGMLHHFGNPTGCSLLCGSYSNGNGRDVIYQFTVGVAGAWKFDLCSTNPAWDNALQIRMGDVCPGSSCVAADGDGCEPDCPAPYQSKLMAVLTTGVTYFLIIDSYSAFHPGAPYTLRWTPPPVCGNGVIEPGEQCDDSNTNNGDGCSSLCQYETPKNDPCPAALPISEGLFAYTLAGSSLDGSAPTPCDANMENDVWFAYAASCNGYATIATCDEAGTDTILQVYSSCTCTALTNFVPPACSDDDCGGGPGFSSIVTVPVEDGACYMIRLGGSNGGTPTGQLTVDCFTPVCGNGVKEMGEECDDGNSMSGDGCDSDCQFEPPVNDLCQNATLIVQVPHTDTNITWGGASEDRTVSCALALLPTRYGFWYRYLAPGDCLLSVSRSGIGGPADTIAALWTGSTCASLVEAACADEETAEFPLLAGVEYRLLIGAWATFDPAPETLLNIEIDCSLPGCGNGSLQPGEQCDDGNTNDGDGCSGFCQYEGACCFEDGSCADLQSLSACLLAGGEFQGGQTICIPALCPNCGNGTVEAGEQCDDNNLVSGDGCSADCFWEGACCVVAECHVTTPAICAALFGAYQGNVTTCPSICGLGACCEEGICSITLAVTCLGDYLGIGSACMPDPCPAVCGNGEWEPGEECDDGNTNNGDGCDSGCMSEGIICATHVDCALADDNVCTCDLCAHNVCMSTAIRFGNVNCTGPSAPNIDDILCVLAGFSSFAACPNGDIAPGCSGNNVINLDDILRVLGAFAGQDPCSCPF